MKKILSIIFMGVLAFAFSCDSGSSTSTAPENNETVDPDTVYEGSIPGTNDPTAAGGKFIVVGGERTGSESDSVIRVYDLDGHEDTNWQKVFDMGGIDVAMSAAVDSNGDIYIAGTANYSSGDNLADVWIKKYSSDGTEITTGWNKSFVDRNSDFHSIPLVIDSNDNVYVGGTQSGDYWIRGFTSAGADIANFDPFTRDTGGQEELEGLAVDSTGLYFTGMPGGTSLYVGKIDLINAADIGTWPLILAPGDAPSGTYSFADARGSVTLDGSGNVYIPGNLQDAGGLKYWWIKKYDSNKNELTGFDKIVYMDDESLRNIRLDSGGNVICNLAKKYQSDGTEVTGWTFDESEWFELDSSDNILYGERKVGSDTYYDWLIKKYNSAGSVIWQFTVDAGPSDGSIGDEGVGRPNNILIIQ